MRRRARGILITDAAMGLIIVSMLMTVLFVATASQRRGGEALAERRTLLRLAEGAATALQRGEQPPQPARAAQVNEPDTRLRFTELADGEPIGDQTWARISVERGGREVSLTTLVPREPLRAHLNDAAEASDMEGVR